MKDQFVFDCLTLNEDALALVSVMDGRHPRWVVNGGGIDEASLF